MSETDQLFRRAAGVLLHPTSLPGPDGIGDLGESARRFVDWLERAGQSLWQVLPLGPTSFGDSPYQTLSAFAGNPLLISLDDLVADGLLVAGDLAARPDFPVERVDFGPVIEWKLRMLATAWERFEAGAAAEDRDDFEAWRRRRAAWLDDYALFRALKSEQGGRPWPEWPAELAGREPAALKAAAERLDGDIRAVCFRQWLFDRQWQRLKAFASARGIRLVGDLPIFVAHDSCDVWANRRFFRLDAGGRPTHVAGVPPDYFSKTGQLWGNPLYDWEALASDGYRWWIDRLRVCLEQVDLVRIDHFRGFAAYWEVPAEAETAVGGRWVQGPGAEFFAVVKKALGDLPVIAEDLGVVTPDVEALRDGFELPGMKVLQFAWSGPENPFLPHEFRRNCVAYSGTHDNDPTLGWWRHLATPAEKSLVSEYAGCDAAEPHWTLIRLGMLSVAHTFIATMQDVLGLGRDGRMNLPGEGHGNWNWRMTEAAFHHPAIERLTRLTYLARRRPDQIPSGPVDHSGDSGAAGGYDPAPRTSAL